jgi:hypothetical protein
LISKRVELVVILACEAEVFDRLIGSVQLPFFLLFDTGREILFVFGCCFIAFPPKKIAVWMAIDWAGAGAGLAVSSLFFFARLTYFIDIHSSTCRRAIICPATIAQAASGERGE